MELIAKNDLNKFKKIVKMHGMDTLDFSFQEIDTTDPKSDEIYAQQGLLTIKRKSNGKSNQYAISDDTSWLDLFSKDLIEGVFG